MPTFFSQQLVLAALWRENAGATASKNFKKCINKVAGFQCVKGIDFCGNIFFLLIFFLVIYQFVSLILAIYLS